MARRTQRRAHKIEMYKEIVDHSLDGARLRILVGASCEQGVHDDVHASTNLVVLAIRRVDVTQLQPLLELLVVGHVLGGRGDVVKGDKISKVPLLLGEGFIVGGLVAWLEDGLLSVCLGDGEEIIAELLAHGSDAMAV